MTQEILPPVGHAALADARYLAFLDHLQAPVPTVELLAERHDHWRNLLERGVPDHLHIAVARATAGAFLGYLIGVREPGSQPPQEYRVVVNERFSGFATTKALLKFVGITETKPEELAAVEVKPVSAELVSASVA